MKEKTKPRYAVAKRCVVVVAIAALGACGGNTERSVPTTFHLTAFKTAFDIKRFSVPADTAFSVVLANEDRGVRHSFGIYRD